MINPSQDPVLGHLGGGEQIKKAEDGGRVRIKTDNVATICTMRL